MPDAELVTDAAPRDPTQMLDAFLVAAVRPPLRRLGPPAARVVGLFVGLVAATTSLAYVGAHAADAHTPAQLADALVPPTTEGGRRLNPKKQRLSLIHI